MSKMLKAVVLASLAAMALLLGVTASASAGTLDQQQIVGSADSFIDDGQSLAQTFTAGLSGNLDQVDLDLRSLNAPTLPVTVEIRDVAAGSPGSTVLATQSVAPSAITGTFALVPITFAVPASVAAGTQYAIVTYSATPTPATEYSWARNSSDVYAGGKAVYVSTSPPSGIWLNDVGDHVFLTYVAPPSAPTGSTSGSTPTGTTPTGMRAAALARCKKRAHKHHWSHKRLKACKANANSLPV
jgi:hypothetical protein